MYYWPQSYAKFPQPARPNRPPTKVLQILKLFLQILKLGLPLGGKYVLAVD